MENLLQLRNEHETSASLMMHVAAWYRGTKVHQIQVSIPLARPQTQPNLVALGQNVCEISYYYLFITPVGST